VREGKPLRDNNILVRFLKSAGRKEHLQQLTVDWVERGAGAECIVQLDSAQQIIAEVGAKAATFSFGQAPLFLGGSVPRRGRERESIR
jgi:hypothetical protein